MKQNVIEALQNDINTPQALSLLLPKFKEVSQLIQKMKLDEAAALAMDVFETLKLLSVIGPKHTFDTFLNKHANLFFVDQETELLASERWAAKLKKDFLRSDEIRKEIENKGHTIIDFKDYYIIRRTHK